MEEQSEALPQLGAARVPGAVLGARRLDHLVEVPRERRRQRRQVAEHLLLRGDTQKCTMVLVKSPT